MQTQQRLYNDQFNWFFARSETGSNKRILLFQANFGAKCVAETNLIWEKKNHRQFGVHDICICAGAIRFHFI